MSSQTKRSTFTRESTPDACERKGVTQRTAPRATRSASAYQMIRSEPTSLFDHRRAAPRVQAEHAEQPEWYTSRLFSSSSISGDSGLERLLGGRVSCKIVPWPNFAGWRLERWRAARPP